MLFNSLNFIIFFVVTITLYYIVPKNMQWKLVLAASLIFYMSWRPELIFLLLGVILINYIGGIAIESAEDGKTKKYRLALALALDFGILAVFKYLMFISNTFGWLYELLGRDYPIKGFSIVLPAGISFYTFQAAGYLIDIYRGNYKSEKSFFRLRAGRKEAWSDRAWRYRRAGGKCSDASWNGSLWIRSIHLCRFRMEIVTQYPSCKDSG